jgi:hypothetical protein
MRIQKQFATEYTETTVIYVGCNKRSALHRKEVSETSGAMPVGYCALQLRHLISPRPLAGEGQGRG